jgi:hypothetical protein
VLGRLQRKGYELGAEAAADRFGLDLLALAGALPGPGDPGPPV